MESAEESDQSFPGAFQAALRAIRHDLRGLIGQITGYEQFLREAAETEGWGRILGDLNQIRAAGERLIEIVMDRMGGATGLGPGDTGWAAVGERLRAEVATIDEHRRAVADALEHLPEAPSKPDADDLAEHQEDLEKIATACRGLLGQFEAWMDQIHAGRWSARPDESSPLRPRDERAPLSTTGPEPLTDYGRGGRLLLVDDDSATREILTRRVQHWGYAAVPAGSAAEALDILTRETVDLVLMDMVMPGLSGAEALRRMKADSAMRGVPVIMLTGIDDQSDVVQCILDGAEDYILKPPNPVLLRARISATLEKQRLRQKLARVLKVFISSPGDVEEERTLAQSVIAKLNVEYQGQLFLDVYTWEHEPLFAHDTFQTQIMDPAMADIYVGIFWARLGSPLPERFSRPDGSCYLSGSEYEFEQAVRAFEKSGQPRMLIYRKMATPMVPITDRAGVLAALEQHERLESFLNKWFKSDGGQGFTRAFHPFPDGKRFATLLYEHLKRLVLDQLETGGFASRVTEPGEMWHETPDT